MHLGSLCVVLSRHWPHCIEENNVCFLQYTVFYWETLQYRLNTLITFHSDWPPMAPPRAPTYHDIKFCGDPQTLSGVDDARTGGRSICKQGYLWCQLMCIILFKPHNYLARFLRNWGLKPSSWDPNAGFLLQGSLASLSSWNVLERGLWSQTRCLRPAWHLCASVSLFKKGIIPVSQSGCEEWLLY